jgi:hypothetical protein
MQMLEQSLSPGNTHPAGNATKQCGQQEPPQQQPWDACSIEQKIERLRVELLNQREQTRWAQKRWSHIENQLRRLDSHQHGLDGTVLIRPRDVDAGYGECWQGITGSYDPLA